MAPTQVAQPLCRAVRAIDRRADALTEIAPLAGLDSAEVQARMLAAWSRLDRDGRFVFGKLLTGAFRVGAARQLVYRALAAFGRNPLFAWFSGYHAEETISDIVLAITSLSARQTGALIVIERREGLKTYIENGIPLDSAVSYDLLVTIFAPGTPLHDGAVIIRGDLSGSPSFAAFLKRVPRIVRAVKNEFGNQERFLTAPLVADGKVIIGGSFTHIAIDIN